MEQNEIIETEQNIAEKEAALQETVEAVEYDAEENEEVTTKTIKDYLKKQADDSTESEEKTMLKKIADIEKEIKELKKILGEKLVNIERKINIKCYGPEAEKEELRNILQVKKNELSNLQTDIPEDKKGKAKHYNAIKKCADSISSIQQRMKGINDFLITIGGVITDEEAKNLILQKHNNLVQQELLKYLNAEKRKLIAGIENLWDKYAVSSKELESKRTDTLNELSEFLMELDYLN
jgi:type I restriction enzyme M protein